MSFFPPSFLLLLAQAIGTITTARPRRTQNMKPEIFRIVFPRGSPGEYSDSTGGRPGQLFAGFWAVRRRKKGASFTLRRRNRQRAPPTGHGARFSWPASVDGAMRPFSRLFALAPDCHAAGNRYGRRLATALLRRSCGRVPTVVFPRDVDFTWARPASERAKRAHAGACGDVAKALEQIRASGAEAVLSYCFATDVEPGLVRDTVALGIPWINFFCDSTYAFDRVEAAGARGLAELVPRGRRRGPLPALGRPWLCRPYALNPDALPEADCATAVHRSGSWARRRGPGAAAGRRSAALGCRVAVRGEGWRRPPRPPEPRTGGPRRVSRLARLAEARRRRLLARRSGVWCTRAVALDDGELTRFVSECRVVLGLNEGGARVAGAQLPQAARRRVPGLRRLLPHAAQRRRRARVRVGREVLTFRGLAEAAASVRDYAAHPALAAGRGAGGTAARAWPSTPGPRRLGEIARAL